MSNRRCGRWKDHRQVIYGILHQMRTEAQWRDLTDRFGPWKTVYESHRLWSADGTWKRLLQQVQAEARRGRRDRLGHLGRLLHRPRAPACCRRPHQSAAGSRLKGGRDRENTRAKLRGRALHGRLAEVVREARAGAVRAAGSPASSTGARTAAVVRCP
ncbi:transposase [Streptomyces chartreusis]